MSADNVRVIIRCRPFNKREADLGDWDIIQQDKEMGTVIIAKPESKDMAGQILKDQNIKTTFTFDGSYGQESTQVEVFDESIRPMIQFCMDGYNTTVFAYGQTGSGKTFTMMGYNGNRGMIPQGIQLIFDIISQAQSNQTYLVRCSFYEIYNESIRDLMNGTMNIPLKETKEKGVYLEGLSEYVVKSEKEISTLLESGNSHRSVGATNMNATSSRSHSIFQIIVECATDTGEKDHIRVGKLNLVDLAGSERAEKTGATGDRLKEGAKINLSLTALGQVIQKLVDGDEFIPYRTSKLTHILKDSLGGNAKTLMIVAISPAASNYEETMSSLRYADRAKRIKNKAKINEDPKDAQIREMRDQIARLEQQLALFANPNQNGQPLSSEQVQAQAQSIEALQQQLNSIQVFKKKVVKKKQSPEEVARELAEQQKLESELKQKTNQAHQARKFVEDMQAKVAEQKKAVAEKDRLEKEAAELERQERQTRQQLVDQKQAQMMLKRQLADAEQKNKEDEEVFNNAQEEREVLKRKIEKYKTKELEVKNELEDLQTQFTKEVQIRQEDLDVLTKENNRLQAILDHFIPKDIQTVIFSQLTYDEQNDRCVLTGADLTGNKKRGFL